MKVSDILIEAADEHLAVRRTNDEGGKQHLDHRSPYVCDAVQSATRHRNSVISFLSDLGMDTGFGVFDHVPKTRRQAARFDFLNLAILIAEDENICA